MFDDKRETFIATLYNVLLAPDLCDRIFSIIKLINAGHTCLFYKGFCMVYFGEKEDNAVTSAVRKPFVKRHVCPAFINLMMENNLSHKFGANSTLYKVTTYVFPLSSHICIHTEPFCFAVT